MARGSRQRSVWRPPREAYVWMERFGCPREPPREFIEYHTPFPWPREEYIYVVWPGECCLHALLGHRLRRLKDEEWLTREWRPTMDLIVEAALATLQATVRPRSFWENYADDPLSKFTTIIASGLARIVVSACHLGNPFEGAGLRLGIRLTMVADINPYLRKLILENACAPWFQRLAVQILGPPPTHLSGRIKSKCAAIARVEKGRGGAGRAP